MFGALISPTDPVAVLSMFEGVRLPPSIKVELQGEALFNDGIGVVLFVLLVGVAAPVLAFPWSRRLSIRNVPFLTWAGVHGGISVALALALPDSAAKPVILSATSAVVLFGLIAQGSTVGTVARATLPTQGSGQRAPSSPKE